MALVKFNTNENMDMELEAIKLSRPNCNTNAAAAKYAVENYLSTSEQLRELTRDYEQLLNQMEQIKETYIEKLEAEKNLKALLEA